MNRKGAESEGSEVRKFAATNGVNAGLADDQPPVKLGLGQSAAPVDSVQNMPPSSGPVKIIGNSKGRERIRERMARAGRGGGRISYSNQRLDQLSTTFNGKMKLMNSQVIKPRDLFRCFFRRYSISH